MCGNSLDRAVLSVSFRQVQRSPCQCHHVSITEGNPDSHMCRRQICKHTSATLTLSFTSFTSLYLVLLSFTRRVNMSLQHTLKTICFASYASLHGLCRVVVLGDILPDITRCRSGWKLCRCCYFAVREGRAGSLRCPDHVSDAMASKTGLD